MWGKLTYKNKCIVICAGFLAFLLIGYRVSFSKTFELKSEIKEKETKLSWLKEKEKEIPFLQSGLDMIEEVCSNDTGSVRDKLTSFISDFSEQNACTVTEIPVNSFYTNEGLAIQTNSFIIKGNFHNLLTLIFELEKTHKYNARIMSAQFYSNKDFQTKRKQLYLKLITQSFKEIEPNTNPS